MFKEQEHKTYVSDIECKENLSSFPLKLNIQFLITSTINPRTPQYKSVFTVP